MSLNHRRSCLSQHSSAAAHKPSGMMTVFEAHSLRLVVSANSVFLRASLNHIACFHIDAIAIACLCYSFISVALIRLAPNQSMFISINKTIAIFR